MRLQQALFWLSIVLQLCLGIDKTSTDYCAFRNENYQTRDCQECSPYKPSTLTDICSEYVDASCCTNDQAVRLSSMSLLKDFGTFPSCRSNLLNLWCAYSCSPQQGSFVVNTDVIDNSGILLVMETEVKLNELYANQLFESCKSAIITYNGHQLLIKDLYNNSIDFMKYISSQYNGNEKVTFVTSVTDKNSLSLNTQNDNTTTTTNNNNNNNNVNNDLYDSDIEVKDTKCQVKIFGKSFTCLAFSLGIIYIIIALVVFGGVISAVMMINKEGGDKINKNNRSKGIVGSSIQDEAPQIKVYTILQRYWLNHARFIARHTTLSIILSFLLVGLMAIGIIHFKLQLNPQNLLVPNNSHAKQNRDYFTTNYGPEQRTEQLIVTPISGDNVVQKSIFLELLGMQEEISNIEITYKDKVYKWNDLCYKIKGTNNCYLLSPLQLFQLNNTNLNKYNNDIEIIKHINYCYNNSLDVTCLSDSLLPLNNDYIKMFGGFDINSNNFGDSKALLVTYLLNEQTDDGPVLLWESEFLKIVSKSNFTTFKVSYFSERSIEDEISMESSVPITTIVVCYIAMWLFLSLTLGDILPFNSLKQLLLRTKFLLSFGGIIVILCSVLFSVGFCSAIGMEDNFLINKIMGIMMLIIGVDNMYLMIHTYNKLGLNAYMSSETRLAETMSSVGSSITMATLCELLGCLLGTLTQLPLIISLSVYISVAIFINYLLQVTLLCAFMVIDGDRFKSNRLDIIPCIQVKPDRDAYESDPLISRRAQVGCYCKLFIQKYYVPFILHPLIKTVAMLFFLGVLFISINYSTEITVGMSNGELFSHNSYLNSYYKDKKLYEEIGPEFSIIIKDKYNYSDINNQNNICSIMGCNDKSLVNLYIHDKTPYIYHNSNNWLDNYLLYAKSPHCCTQINGVPCYPFIEDQCEPCFTLTIDNRPDPIDFISYLPFYLNTSIPPLNCDYAGLLFQQDIVFDNNNNNNDSDIISSKFNFNHKKLKNEEDRIEGIREVYNLMTYSKLNGIVYSKTYEYNDMYLDMGNVLVITLCISIGGVLLFSVLFFRDPFSTICMLVLICSVVINIIGFMKLWYISINPISIFNILIAIGISTQFSVHFIEIFKNTEGERNERVKSAIVELGGTVFIGIALSKLFFFAFAFATSEVITVYFFRMYVIIFAVCASHGLVLFPILLSLFGTQYGKCTPCKWQKKEYRY